MGEDQGSADDVSDLARAGGDVMEGAPAAGELGEPALAQAAKRPLERVIGACIDIEVPAGTGLGTGMAARPGRSPWAGGAWPPGCASAAWTSPGLAGFATSPARRLALRHKVLGPNLLTLRRKAGCTLWHRVNQGRHHEPRTRHRRLRRQRRQLRPPAGRRPAGPGHPAGTPP